MAPRRVRTGTDRCGSAGGATGRATRRRRRATRRPRKSDSRRIPGKVRRNDSPLLIGFQHRLYEAERLRLDPGRGDRRDAVRTQAMPRPGGGPSLPRRRLDLALDRDAVARVVAENDGGRQRGPTAARRERQGDARVRVVALGMLADRRFMPGALQLGHERLEHGTRDRAQALAAHATIRFVLRLARRRWMLRRALGVRLEQRPQLVEGGGHQILRPTSFQNCVSPITVTRWPLAARRLISMSFSPPSLPATWSAFGRPRTRMSVEGPGLAWKIAPDFFAAAIASRRGRRKNPVNEIRRPAMLSTRPLRSCFGACCRASISSEADS